MSESRVEETEWVSPIGQNIEDFFTDLEREDPEFKTEWERSLPYRELARASVTRRTELGISQRELARRVGISHSVIWRLERGERNFTAETMRRLAPLIQS